MEEIELNRPEQLRLTLPAYRESDLVWVVSAQLLTKEHRRKDGPSAVGVGLDAPAPMAVGCGRPEQPQNQRGGNNDEQQGFEALGAFVGRVAQFRSEAMILEVANGLLAMYVANPERSVGSVGATCCF